MKTIRLGNDVQINWYITRFGEPEDFTGKNLTVKLIDKLGEEQVFDYEIDGNRITGIFFGKDQSTNGVYRLLLVENDGEEDMVSLDYIDAFCLSNKMKNQTSNGSDTTSTINTEVEEYESQIDLEQDLFLYAKKTYVNEKIDEVNQRIDDDFYNKEQVDQIIGELPASDTYTKSEIDAKIEDVADEIPTKTSDLTNDSGYTTEQWVENKHYLVAADIEGKADASTVYTKSQVDSKLEGKADVDDVPTKTSDLTNDSGFVSENDLADVATSGSYNDLTNKPVIPSLDGYATEEWVEGKHYLVSADIDSKADASTVYTKVQVDNKLAGKADKSDIPTKTSDLTNDSGFVSANNLADVATSGSYNDLSDKPTIPSLDGYATEEWVENKHYLVSADIAGKADASTVYTKVQVDAKLDGKADKSDIPSKTSELTNDSGFVVESDLADVATSGSYNDLSNKPTIPSLDGYATEQWVENKHYLVASDIAGKADSSTVYNKTQIDNKLSLKADKSEIPSKTSELTNDSGFVSGNDLADVATSGSYNDLTDKPTIPSLDGYATEQWVEGKHYLVAADIAGKADSSTVYTKVQVDSKLDSKADVDDIPTKTSDLTNDSGFIDTTALATLFDGAAYDSSTKRINFKHGNNILAFIDATAFIKDGMVESVVIEDGYVVITFNTDSGKEAIRIDITDIFDPANYYDKTAINGLLAGKQNVILDLNQIRLDASAGAIAYGWGNHAQAGYAKDADLADVAKSGSYNDLDDKPTIPSLDGYATEQWVEGKHYLVANDVSTFVDASTVYTKVQVDNKLALKADKSEIPTKTSDLTNDSGFVSGNDLADVATSGSYNDLTNKPTIPAAPVQSDWNEDDTSDLAYINNKPTIPTKTSDLTNDSNFITQAIAEQNFEAKAWRGTQAEYDALTVIEQNKIYIILPAS